MQHWLFLLGASPDRPEPDYGWIEPSRHLACINGYRILAAKGFLEKPSPERCRKAMSGGALWNTMILAARLETLWKMGWTCFPEVMRLFEAYGEAIGTSDEASVLEAIFQVMPIRNFSTHLLQHAHAQLAVVEMTGVPSGVTGGGRTVFWKHCLMWANGLPSQGRWLRADGIGTRVCIGG